MTIVKRVFDAEGLRGFWKGLSISLVLSSNPALMFTLCDQLAKLVTRLMKTETVTAAMMFNISAAAKTIATLLTYPLIRAKIVQQTNALGVNLSIVEILGRIWTKERLRGLYNGVWVLSYKTVLFNALLMAVKTRMNMLYSEMRKRLRGDLAIDGVGAALSGGVESMLGRAARMAGGAVGGSPIATADGANPQDAGGKVRLYDQRVLIILFVAAQYFLQLCNSLRYSYCTTMLLEEEDLLACRRTNCNAFVRPMANMWLSGQTENSKVKLSAEDLEKREKTRKHYAELREKCEKAGESGEYPWEAAEKGKKVGRLAPF